jgi:ATP-dependent Clp protease ATP-binding subunit ClpC
MVKHTMNNNFTDDTNSILRFAEQEARRLHHQHVDSAHLLLGLIRLRGGVAEKVLANLGIDRADVRRRVETSMVSGLAADSFAQPTLTAGANRVLEHATDEAQRLNHEFVDADHLLVGLLRESNVVTSRILTDLGLRLEEVEEEIRHVLDQRE